MPRYTDEEKARARRLREEGATHAEVARKIGCTEMTSQRWERTRKKSTDAYMRLLHANQSYKQAYISKDLLDYLCAEAGERLAWRYSSREGLWIAPTLRDSDRSISPSRTVACASLFDALPSTLARHHALFVPTEETKVDERDPFITWFGMAHYPDMQDGMLA